MSEIIPAILPKDFDDLYEHMNLVADYVPLVQIDVTDGTLTPDSTWPYKGDREEFDKIISEDEGFPLWEDVGFEVHLMVGAPEGIAEDWIRLGAQRVIVQAESFESGEDLSTFLGIMRDRYRKGSLLDIEFGLALNMETSIESMTKHVLEADFIQLMAINEIGGQGREFEPKVFDKIRMLRANFPEIVIAVDGGVSLENADQLLKTGANRLVVGSAIFSAEEPLDALEDFLDIKRKYDPNR
jgi:ribulose-phosphate 3-epimerase